MSPEEFFRSAPFGSRIRYGNPSSPIVTVNFIVRRGTMYAHGIEDGTRDRVFLILDNHQLKDPNRGRFDSVEVLE